MIRGPYDLGNSVYCRVSLGVARTRIHVHVYVHDTYDAVPQGAIVPENDILFVVTVGVYILGREDRPHDSDRPSERSIRQDWLKSTYRCIKALTSFRSSTTVSCPSGLLLRYSFRAPWPWTWRDFWPVLGLVHTMG